MMKHRVTPLGGDAPLSDQTLELQETSPMENGHEEVTSEYSGSTISSSVLPKSIAQNPFQGDASFMNRRKTVFGKILSKLSSIQIILPIFVIAQIVITIAVITGIQLAASIQGVFSVTDHLQSKINEIVDATTKEIITRPLHSLTSVGVAHNIGGWNETDEISMRRVLWEQYQVIAKDKIASAIGIATSDEMYMVYSMANNRFSMSGSHWPAFFDHSDKSMNPRGLWSVPCDQKTGEPILSSSTVINNATYIATTRPQYTGAIKFYPEWYSTPISVLAGGFPAMFISQAVSGKSDSNPSSAVFISMELSLLNQKLREIFVSPNGHTFMVEPNGMLVASGLGDSETNRIVRHLVNESDIEPIKETARALLRKYGSFEDVRKRLIKLEENSPLSKTGESEKSVIMTSYTTGLASKWVQISRFTFGSTIDWMVVVVIPETDFMMQVYVSAGITVAIAVLVLIVSTTISVILSIIITRPLQKLQGQMESVAMLRLDSHRLFKRDKVTLQEVRGIQDSFRRMVYALVNFRKFVPDTVIRLAMEEQDVLKAKLEVCEDVTISFLDIENFTALSEQLSLDSLITVISEAMEVCSNIVTEEGACIDKYIGDCIMALYNVPHRVERHHHRACSAALRCHAALRKFHRSWAERGLPMLRCRIGIHSGECLVGNFGSTNRLNFTAVGDTVNTAARLEPLNKVYETRILITRHMYEIVKDEFCCRCVDIVRVRGKSNSTTIYELINWRHKASSSNLRVEQLMEQWFECYRTNDVDGAREVVEEALKEHGYDQDTALLRMQTRIIQFMEHPELVTNAFEYSENDF